MAGRGGDIMVCRTDITSAVLRSNLMNTAMFTNNPAFFLDIFGLEGDEEIDSDDQ